MRVCFFIEKVAVYIQLKLYGLYLVPLYTFIKFNIMV